MPEPYNTLRSQTGSFYEVEVVCGNRSYDIHDIYELSIELRLFEGSGPSIGNACAATCRLRVKESSANWPRMAAFTLRLRLSSADGQTKAGWLPMGTWYTDTRAETENGFLTVEAFDGMLKTEQFWTDVVPEEDLPASWPITAKAWLDMIEDAGLITLDSRNAIDNTVAFIGLDTTATVRDVLKTIAAAHGGNWVMTFENKLRLMPLQNAGDTGADSVSIGLRAQSLDTSPALAAVSGVRLETENGTVITAGTTTGYVLQAQCNFADSDGVAALCLGRTQGYVYRPFAAGRANLDPAAEIGDIAVIGQQGYQMMSANWNIRTWPTADIAAAFEEEVNHEYNYLDESAKTYRKSVKYTDGKADELQGEITAAETAIEQTAEEVKIVASAIGAEKVVESDNLMYYPLSEDQVINHKGLTFLYNYDGSVSIDGTTTAAVYYVYAQGTTLDSDDYTFSVETPIDFNPSTSYNTPFRVAIGNNDYDIGTVTTGDIGKVYYTTQTAAGNIGFILAVNSGEEIHTTIYPQVVAGTNLKEWEPPVGASAIAASSERFAKLEASLKVTAEGLVSEASRAQAAENALIADVDVEYIKWDYPDDGVAEHVPPPNDPHWSTDSPGWEAGKYIWQRTKTTAGGGSTTTSSPTCIQGAAATAYSLQISNGVIVQKESGYEPASITLNAKAQSGEASMTDYAGRFKIETTADGSSWTSRYTSSSNESSKSYTLPTNITFTALRCSLYAAGGTTKLLDQEVIPLVSGGAQGEDGYTVVLTNSNHTFAGDDTAAIAGQSAECYVIAYKGTTQMAVNIGTITGMPTGMPTPTISGNNTVNAKFTVSVTASMTTKSGVLTVPVTVDGKSFSMKFSYSLALAGETGDDGISPTKIEEQYIKTTSSQTVPSENDPNWSNQQPVWESGKYIWTRSEITWSDHTAQNPHITHTTAVLAKAINGANETAYVVDQDMNFTVTQSRNIAPYPIRSNYTVYGVTFTFNPDGSITVKGTSTSSAGSVLLTKSSFTKPNGKYLLFVEAPTSFPTSGSYPFEMGAINASNDLAAVANYTSDYAQYSGNTVWYAFSDITGGTNFQIRVYLKRSTTYNHTFYPQMVLTDELTAWSPPVGATLRLNMQMKYASSQIVQTADGITSTVKKGNVISSINQSAEAITINANKLNLTGYITATDVGATGSTVINGSRIYGGTLTLGGSGGLNGELLVKNINGDNVVRLNQAGIRLWCRGSDSQSQSLGNFGLVSVDSQGHESDVMYATDGGFVMVKGVIQGPTIIAGGVNNTNGTISVNLNSSGSEYIRLDNSGIVVSYSGTNTTITSNGYYISNRSNQYSNYNYNNLHLGDNWYGDYADIGLGGVDVGTSSSWSDHSYMLGGEIYAGSELATGGSKPRIVQTKNFGKRRLCAYETPTPMFGDIGDGVLDEDGKAYIFFDPVFAETVSEHLAYHVFLQAYGDGKCWVERRTPGYFVVEGTPGLSFAWEAKVKQIDYDQWRMEPYEIPKERAATQMKEEQRKVDESAFAYINNYYKEIESV